MKCPGCTRTMREDRFAGHVVDVCECGGIWFDAGEMQPDGTDAEIGPLVRAAFERPAPRKPRDGKCCPRCDRALEMYPYAPLPDVWLEGCPLGEGVFAYGATIRDLMRRHRAGDRRGATGHAVESSLGELAFLEAMLSGLGPGL